MKQVESEIKEAARDRLAIYPDMFLRQMPSSRAEKQHGDLIVEPIIFPFGTCELDRSANRIAKVDLAFDHVCPSRRIGIFAIGHENFRTRIERVDYHFSIGWTRNFDPSILKIRGDRSNCPSRFSNLLCFGEEIWCLAGIDFGLSSCSSRQQFFAAPIELAVEFRYKTECIGS